MISLTSAQWNEWVALLVFPLTRILAMIATTPLLGDQEVPQQVRIGLALILALLLAPTLPGPIGVEPASAQGLWILAQQILIGAIMGFSIRIVYGAVAVAGELSGLQMGLGFASFYDPQNASFQPLIAQFMGTLLSLIFLSINGHLLVLSALADSFRILPIQQGSTLHALGLHALLSSAGGVFADAVQIALPLLGALIMTNFALGILTRSAPQLNLFAVGFPITLAAGFVVLTLSFPYFVPLAERYIHASLQTLHQVLKQLGP